MVKSQIQLIGNISNRRLECCILKYIDGLVQDRRNSCALATEFFLH